LIIVRALLEHVQSISEPNVRPEVAQLVERLRQLVDMLYPGQSYPHEVRGALERIQKILRALEHCDQDDQVALQNESAALAEHLLQSLRDHAHHRKQELHEQARRFADLEHTAVQLAMECQTDIARSQREAPAATM
jgi:hypothetical protein